METNVLERAAEIAKSNLEKIKAPAVAKAAEEAKVASAAKAEADAKQKKDEGIAASTAELKAKEDERILNAKDAELKDDEKKAKAELVVKREKEENTPDAKIKRVQEASQKRIDEIKSELLAKEDLSKKEMEKLRAEIEALKAPKKEEDLKAKINREIEERNAKFVEEDKSKPYEQRREMTKDDLNSWYLEDPVEATKWIQRREYRVLRELEKAEQSPVDNTDEKRRLANDFVAKQQESREKLLKKYPGIAPSKEQIAEIRNSLGLPLDRNLNQEEMKRFNDKFAEKSPEFKACVEIVNENPKKYLEQVDGPELAMAEIEKRLKSGSSVSSSGRLELTQEELDAKIEAEIERRRLADGEGSHSTNGGKKVEKTNKSGTSLTENQLRVASKAKIGAEAYQKMVDRRDRLNVPSSGRGEDRD